MRKPTKWDLELSDDKKQVIGRIHSSKLVLKALEDEIDALLKRGAGFKNISDALSDQGVEIHRTTVGMHLKKLFPQYVVNNKFAPSEALLLNNTYATQGSRPASAVSIKDGNPGNESKERLKKGGNLIDTKEFEELDTHQWKRNHERDKGTK